MRSASSAATARSWVTNRIEEPVSSRMAMSSARISAWTVTSRAVVGSSATTRSGPAGEASLLPAGADHLPAVEQDAAGDGRRRGQQPEGGETEDALAGARLADEADDLAGGDVQRHAAQRPDGVALGRGAAGAGEGDGEVPHRKDRRQGCAGPYGVDGFGRRAHAGTSSRMAASTSWLVRRAPVCRYSIASRAAVWARTSEPPTQSSSTRTW